VEAVLAIVVGVLYGTGFYLMLRRSIVKLIIGLVLLGNAANVLIFTAAGLTRGSPPLVSQGHIQPLGPIADPLPQALILTAIVIGFGVMAFAMVLVYRTYQATGTDDIDKIKSTDP
jgi:multicomponent Na+:H+ antiporter subunit C